VVKTRLLSYEVETRPLLDYYVRRGILTHIDGNRPAGEVTAALTAQLRRHGVVPAQRAAGLTAVTN